LAAPAARRRAAMTVGDGSPSSVRFGVLSKSAKGDRIQVRLPIATVFLATIFLALTACERHLWEGMVYPKTGQPPYDVAIGHFASLEECRAAALAILAKIRAEPGATPDYECGRDCRVQKEPPPPPGMAPMRICKETAR